MNSYTPGEVKALIAPILGLSAEDVDKVVIIVKGYCTECGKRDMTTCYDSMGGDLREFAGLLNDGLETRIAIEHIRQTREENGNNG